MKPIPLKFARYRNGNSWGMEYAMWYRRYYPDREAYEEACNIPPYDRHLHPIRYRIAATIRFRVNTGRNIAKNRRRHT
jgi:hypothetical protein